MKSLGVLNSESPCRGLWNRVGAAFMGRLAWVVVLTLMSGFGRADSAKVFFQEPKDGAIVGKTFHVKMEVQGRAICPAGLEPKDKTCGHHHILIDSAPAPTGTVIPADANHLHFGKGQVESDITLPPGKHRLTLQFADYAHRSFGAALAKTIEVEVK